MRLQTAVQMIVVYGIGTLATYWFVERTETIFAPRDHGRFRIDFGLRQTVGDSSVGFDSQENAL